MTEFIGFFALTFLWTIVAIAAMAMAVGVGMGLIGLLLAIIDGALNGAVTRWMEDVSNDRR